VETARRIAAGAFAFTAGFSAMAAMEMHTGVTLALLGTDTTRDSARIDHAAHRVLIATRTSDHQRAGSHADIGAVKLRRMHSVRSFTISSPRQASAQE